MSASLSIWLDLSRILAALAVFVGHSVALGVAPSQLSLQWHRSADDAVTAFFVISGLVIAHTTRVGHADAKSYALARLSRVYSVALPAVLIAFAIDLWGMRFDVSQYSPNFQYPKLWLYLPLHWLFLGETWFGAIYPFTMAPYWSLGYEVWYYVLFGCIMFLKGRTRWIVTVIVLMIMGPRIWLLLPTWWLGVAISRNLDRVRLDPRAGWALMLLSLVGYLSYLVSGLRAVTDAAAQDLYALFSTILPLPFFRGSTVHVLSDYLVAASFAVFVVGCANCRFDFGDRIGSMIRSVAGYTFSFYIIHFTLLVFARALGFGSVFWGTYGLIFGAVLCISWGLGQIGEQRRVWYRSILSRVWSAMAKS